MEGRQKKHSERNDAFEQAKEAVGRDRLPFETLDEKSSGDDGGNEEKEDDSMSADTNNGVSHVIFSLLVLHVTSELVFQ